jgi:hypothetical protein
MPTHTRQFPSSLLLQLRGNPSPAVIAAAADHLARQAATRQSPAKSVHAAVRYLRMHDAVKLSVAAALVEAAITRLPEKVPMRGSLAWAARTAGLNERTLNARLRTVEGRRLYGWPIWRGAGIGWEFDVQALEPVTRGAYLRSLPLSEPEIASRFLPSWCEREVRSEQLRG